MGLLDFLSPALTVASQAVGAHNEGEQEGNALLRAIGLKNTDEELKRAQAADAWRKSRTLQLGDPGYKEQMGGVAGAQAAAREPYQTKPQPHTVGSTDGFFQVGQDGTTTPLKGPNGQILRPHEPKVQQEPKGQVVQGPNGPILVDPRSGTSRGITDPNGNALKAKPPTQITQAINSNKMQVSKIDRAIQLLQDHPTAVGLRRRGMPDAVSQISDPDGIGTRAMVSNIGSLLIHDRTGAAMSAAESQRLKPFIPGPTDQSAGAIKKLQQLRELVMQDTDFMNQSFGTGGVQNPWRP